MGVWLLCRAWAPQPLVYRETPSKYEAKDVPSGLRGLWFFNGCLRRTNLDEEGNEYLSCSCVFLNWVSLPFNSVSIFPYHCYDTPAEDLLTAIYMPYQYPAPGGLWVT